MKKILRRFSAVALRLVFLLVLVIAASGALVDNTMAREAPPDGPDYVEHSGNIAGTEIWTVADNPHVIRDSGLTINTTGKVILEPGVIIWMEGPATLTVQGTLTMTVSAPSVLTTITNTGSYFGKIDFQTNSRGFLGNCDISHGGAGVTEVLTISSINGVKVENCRIHDNLPASQVVYMFGPNAKATLKNLTLDNNEGLALVQSSILSKITYENVMLDNNDGGDLLEVGRSDYTVGNGGRVTLSGDQILPDGIIYLANGATVGAGGALTVTAGTNLQLGMAENLLVQWNGTNGPGRFYSDGVTYSKRAGRGYFGQIYFNANSIGTIKNCEISNGGSGAGIFEVVKIASSNVTIEDCAIHNVSAANRIIYIGTTGTAADIGLSPTLRNIEVYASTAQYVIEQSLVDMAVTYENINAHDNYGAYEGVYLGGGTLNRPLVLDQQQLNGDPYYVGHRTSTAGLTIEAAGAVTMTAGTELRILPGQGITVRGSLSGMGTLAQPVRLRAQRDNPINATYYWRLVDIQPTGRVSLEYCEVFHATGGVIPAPVNLDAVFSIASSSTTLSNCTLRNSGSAANTIAVLIAGAGNKAELHSVTISNNSGWGLGQNELDMNPVYQDIILDGNNSGIGDVLFITGASLTAIPDLATGNDVVFDSPSLNGKPVYLPNGALIQAGGAVTVTASTNVQLGSGSPGKNFEVSGSLYAVGAPVAGQEVVFSNKGDVTDDQFGRLDFNPGSTGELRNCQVMNGGKGLSEMLRIESSAVLVEDCTLSGGIETASSPATAQAIQVVAQGLTPVLRNLLIANNLGYAVGQGSANMAPVYDNLLFQGNTIDGLFLGASTAVNYDQLLNIDEINGAPYYASNITMLTGKTLTLTPGTELRLLQASTLTINTGASLVLEGTPARWITLRSNLETPTTAQYWTGILVQNGASASVKYIDLSRATAPIRVLTSALTPSDFALDYANLHHNGSAGGQQVVSVSGVAGTPTPIYTFTNLAIHDNTGTGLHATTNVVVNGYHLSLIRNTSNGAQTVSTAVMHLFNTIIAYNTTGFNSGSVGSTTEAVLWHGNTNKVTGSVVTPFHDIDALALPLEQDGYHLTRYASEAMNYALPAATSVVDDIDSEARPQPVGENPDLGADEYIFSYGADYAAEKAAWSPKFVVTPSGAHVWQKYLVRIFQGLPGLNLSFMMNDSFPAVLDLTGEEHPFWMDFSQVGNELTWQSTQLMGTGDAALVLIDGVAELPNGTQIVNTGVVDNGMQQLEMSVTTVVPVFKPLISTPLSGAVCAGNVDINGAAQAGATIRLYANGVQFTTTTVGLDSRFASTYGYAGGNVSLTAEACFGATCSGQAVAVVLTPCSGQQPTAAGSLSGSLFNSETGVALPVPDMTVTLMAWLPDWGGWVPWPASLYGEINPKTNEANGTYAFTNLPPGDYYLQVAASAGFQAYHSPETAVTSGGSATINVPLTTEATTSDFLVEVSSSSVLPASINIHLGQTVEWTLDVDGLVQPSVLIGQVENPVVRILTDLDPQTEPNGWDSGMLYPGQSFRRTFNEPGTYTYTDGQGHTATIIVLADWEYIYLPLVLR